VVPLQDLVQNDAVEKAAQPQSKENAGCNRKVLAGNVAVTAVAPADRPGFS
jgi:hypothetical protein